MNYRKWKWNNPERSLEHCNSCGYKMKVTYIRENKGKKRILKKIGYYCLDCDNFISTKNDIPN